MPTTGLAPLPDVGTLSYNGVVFSCLFKTNLSGFDLKDNAARTIKAVEFTLTAEGYVTLETGQTTIDITMQKLIRLLNAQGGILTYSGKGMGQNFAVNKPGGVMDVAWGPVPKVLEAQPMGNSASALIKWQVVFTIPYSAVARGPLMQFNEEIDIGFDEDTYCNYTIKGTMEIPMTRISQRNNAVPTSVDAQRERFMQLVANTIDLTRFRVTQRAFNVSRDKRLMEWEFHAEELPPAGLPFGAPTARGTFSFHPVKMGPGVVKWWCTLDCTYTMAKTQPRRMAWFHFSMLLAFRMAQSRFANIVINGNNANNAQQPPPPANNTPVQVLAGLINNLGVPGMAAAWVAAGAQQRPPGAKMRALAMDLRCREGLYLDSKTINFSASWVLFTTMSHILQATGIWRDSGVVGGNFWATSMRNIMGWRGNLKTLVDPTQDAIIDLQLGAP